MRQLARRAEFRPQPRPWTASVGAEAIVQSGERVQEVPCRPESDPGSCPTSAGAISPNTIVLEADRARRKARVSLMGVRKFADILYAIPA
jgi:hypothetical protein